MADVPVRFAGLRGTLAAFAVDLFAGRMGSLTDAPMCSGGYDRWGVYDGSAWRLGPASDYAGNANVLSLLVNGTSVIDSSRNVKGATLWSGGAIRVDGNGDGTLRNASLAGFVEATSYVQSTLPTRGWLAGIRSKSATPSIAIIATGAPTDEKCFDWIVEANGVIRGRLVNDASTGNNPWIEITRTGYVPTGVKINCGLGVHGVTPPTTRPTVNATATDLATVIALTNQLRSALIACGIIQ